MIFSKEAYQNSQAIYPLMEKRGNLVQPTLIEKEMNMTFLNTLHTPYYDKVVKNATKKFIDLVLSSKMIDAAIKSEGFL